MNKEQRDKMADEYVLTVYKDLDSIGAKYMVKDFAAGFDAGHASRQSEIDELRRALMPLAYSVEKHSDKSLLDYVHVEIRVTPQQIINARTVLTKHKGGKDE